MTGLTGARGSWLALLLALGSVSGVANGDEGLSEDAGAEEWVWAFAPAVGYTSSLGWTASGGVFGGPVVGTPSEGYSSALGVLLQAEASPSSRRYAAGVHLVVSPIGLPLVGTLGAGVNAAYVESQDATSQAMGPGRTTLLGPELQIVFIGRLRIGYLFQTSPDASGAGSRSGLTWSIGLGF